MKTAAASGGVADNGAKLVGAGFGVGPPKCDTKKVAGRGILIPGILLIEHPPSENLEERRLKPESRLFAAFVSNISYLSAPPATLSDSTRRRQQRHSQQDPIMRLINQTHHEAELVRLSLDDARSAGIVVVKSTYDIDRGRASLSRRQRRVLLRPEVEENVELEPEGVAGKIGVDVVAVGATAGDGRTQTSSVSIRIGEWSSCAIVFGDRQWRRSMLRWMTTDPQPFWEMPVAWSTAFGGTARSNDATVLHPGNPLGKGYIVDVDDRVEGTPLPNIEDPADLLRQPGQSVVPFSFAPLPISSGLRLEPALDDSKTAGINKAIYNVAPPRHRLAELHGGERCEAHGWVGMGAEVFELPRESFMVEVRVDDREYELRPQLDTVCLWPSKRQLVTTRRATFTYQYQRNVARVARLRQVEGGRS